MSAPKEVTAEIVRILDATTVELEVDGPGRRRPMTCKLNGIKAPATLGLEVMAKKWLMQNLPLYHKLRIKLFAASTTKNDEFLVEIFLTSEATSLNQLAVKENVLLTYSA